MNDCINVDKNELVFEYMMNRLRLMEAIPFQEFENYTGLHVNVLSAQLKQATQKGLIVVNEINCQVTPLGHRYLNELLTIFMD